VVLRCALAAGVVGVDVERDVPFGRVEAAVERVREVLVVDLVVSAMLRISPSRVD
jgi:hypothetical protein